MRSNHIEQYTAGVANWGEEGEHWSGTTVVKHRRPTPFDLGTKAADESDGACQAYGVILTGSDGRLSSQPFARAVHGACRHLVDYSMLTSMEGGHPLSGLRLDYLCVAASCVSWPCEKFPTSAPRLFSFWGEMQY